MVTQATTKVPPKPHFIIQMTFATIIWEAERYERTINTVNLTGYFFPLKKLSRKIKPECALYMDIIPSVSVAEGSLTSMIFTKFSIKNGLIFFDYFDTTVPGRIDRDTTIKIRKISKMAYVFTVFITTYYILVVTDIFPSILNKPVASKYFINVFMDINYIETLSGSGVVPGIANLLGTFLKSRKLKVLDYEVSLLPSNSEYTSIYKFNSVDMTLVMNVTLKLVTPSNKHLNLMFVCLLTS